MSIFWTLFWLGFIGMPLMVFLASLTGTSGYEKDTSHIWVYKRSKAKAKDANVRDVWKHNHPGKSWEDHQERQFIGCSIFLVVAFLGFLTWLSNQIFSLPDSITAKRVFWQVGAPILGGLSAAVIAGLVSLTKDVKSGFLKVLNILAWILMGVGVVGGLVLTFLGHSLPISHNWIWAPLAAVGFFLALDSFIGRGKKKRSIKGGNELGNWVVKVKSYYDGNVRRREFSAISAHLPSMDAKSFGIMFLEVAALQLGYLDYLMRDKGFFKETEGIMLDLVRGRPMSISDPELYNNRNEIIRALQAFYFYAVKKSGFAIHPRIKTALKK